jgi:membrane protein implicated in regulation of membrane protease activity
MATLVAILLAIFVLPSPWGLVVVLVGLVVDIAETWLWVRLSRRRRSVSGAEALVGKLAAVVDPCRPRGRVRVDGELWSADCEVGADAGATVRIRAVENLLLRVEPE